MLEMVALKGLRAEIQTRGDSEKKLAYSNHRTSAKYRGVVLGEERQRILPLAEQYCSR